MYRGLDEVREFLTHMHSNLDVTGSAHERSSATTSGRRCSDGLASDPGRAGREVRSAFSVLLEQRDGKIGRYQFLENTFDVALAFRTGGSWAFQTDGTTKFVPAER